MTKITLKLVQSLISEQFPECANLPIKKVEKQGHDNRTYRLGGCNVSWVAIWF
jgi:aminoglycoside phosphotransferase (APT) family kinase protein